MQVEFVLLPDIDDNNIYFFVLSYQSYINSIIKNIKCICRCYKLFVLEKKSQIFTINNCFICNFDISKFQIFSNIDDCSIFDNGICLCLTYKKLLLLKN